MRLCSLKYDAGGLGKECKGQGAVQCGLLDVRLLPAQTQQLWWLPEQVQARHSSGDERGGDVVLPLTEEPLTATEKETHLSLGWGGLW